MLRALTIAQIVIAVFLSAAILLQQRGGGLSTVFGGEGSVYRTRRGAEKMLFWGTIILAALFLATAGLQIALR